MWVSRRVLVLVALLAAAGGGVAAGLILTEDDSGSGGAVNYVYPRAGQEAVLKSCGNRRSHDACLCVLHAFEKTMPYDVYISISRVGIQAPTRDAWAAFGRESSKCPQ